MAAPSLALPPGRTLAALLLVAAVAGCGGAHDGPVDAGVGDDLAPGADLAGAGPADLAAADLAGPADLGHAPDLAGPPDLAGALTLDVLSMNAWSSGLDQVAADIAGSGADVVGMQEISPPEVQKICAQLGADWSFVHDDGARDYAILSRYPIVGRIGVTAVDHGGLGATIELAPGRRAHVFNVHLSYTPYGPYQLVVDKLTPAQVVASENQVRMGPLGELLTMAAPYLAVAEPTFLTGDFNAPSDLDYSPAMPWPTSVAPRSAGFVDSWAQLHPELIKKWAGQFLIGDPGITWTSIPSSEPNGCFDRIDFVYYSAGDAWPTASQALTVPSSDHRVVSTRFALPDPTLQPWATNPLPPDRAIHAPRHVQLTWLPGAHGASERLSLDTITPPEDGVGKVAGSRYRTRLLARATTYYWRVDQVTGPGAIMVGDVWSFTTGDGPGIAADKDVYAAGETMSVRFDSANNARDWIGIYRRGDPYGDGAAALGWKYLNDTTTAPAGAASDGTVTLAGQPAGSYVIRFFANDGYSVQDDIGVTVQ